MKNELLVIDTETTGIDLWHGCEPFMISYCGDSGETVTYQVRVDPFTRKPHPFKEDDLRELRHQIDIAEKIIFHNAQFDVRVLSIIGVDLTPHWNKIHDTSILSHVLHADWKVSLKDICATYFLLEPDDQDALQKLAVSARRYGKKKKWRIADEGDPHFPAAKKPGWENDMWLVREAAIDQDLPPDDPKQTTCQIYCERDVRRTWLLWIACYEAIQDEELTTQYEMRRKLLPIFYNMTSRGVRISKSQTHKSIIDYRKQSKQHEQICLRMAKKPELRITSDEELREVLYKQFDLPVIARTEKENKPTTKADFLKQLVTDALPRPRKFLRSLIHSKKATKAADYLESYLNYGVTHGVNDFRLHPTFKIPGTSFVRQSSSNPNLQNVSTGKERDDGVVEFLLREVFGPGDEWEWWAIDYSNLELRIWAYSCGNRDLIEAFEQGVSVHLVIARELHPYLRDLSDEEASSTKDYKKTKNGNFAKIYGGGDHKVDLTYGVKGASAKIADRFPEVASFSRIKQEEVLTRGFVETYGNYRINIGWNEPHKAVNGFVQGSAGWFMGCAMIDVEEYLKQISHTNIETLIQVHDELVLRAPKGTSLQYAAQIAERMSRQGDVYGVPTPVGFDRITDTWASGVGCDLPDLEPAPF